MDVKVVKCEGCNSLLAYHNNHCLFQFEHRKDEKKWYFWMPGRAYDPETFDKFPEVYFKNACRAAAFMFNTGTADRELLELEVNIVSGKSYLK